MVSNLINKLNSENFKFEEYALTMEDSIQYWHSNIINNQGISQASGFGSNKQNARKIAVSEFLERSKFKEIKMADLKTQKSWGLDLISTGCGFAAGFDLRNTIIRSIGESVERWVISKWIDDDFLMEHKNQSTLNMDSASIWFLNQFEKVHLFNKEISVYVSDQILQFTVFACVGIWNGGAYPGFAVSLKGQMEGWQHALLECYRHKLVILNNPITNNFPENRIRFFSKNAELAELKIFSKKQSKWPIPVVKFHKSEFINNEFYIARTILDGWKAWNIGSIDRFVF